MKDSDIDIARGLARGARCYDPMMDQDDLASEAVLNMLKARSRHDPSKSRLSTFAYRSMRQAIGDALKRQQNESRVVRGVDMDRVEGDQPEVGSKQENREFVEHLILHLAPKDRWIVVMRFYHNMTFERIGIAIGTTAQTASRRLDRAIQDMQREARRQKVM